MHKYRHNYRYNTNIWYDMNELINPVYRQCMRRISESFMMISFIDSIPPDSMYSVHCTLLSLWSLGEIKI